MPDIRRRHESADAMRVSEHSSGSVGGCVGGAFIDKSICRHSATEIAETVDSPFSSSSLAAPPICRYTVSYAIKRGYFNLVRCLLTLGADANHVACGERQLRTPLIYATYVRDDAWSLSIARTLLEHGASLRQTDARYLNALHYCCAFGRAPLLALLLDSLDFDLCAAIDLNGNTCMHYAVFSHSVACVRLLARKCKQSSMQRCDLMNVFGLRPSNLQLDDDAGDSGAGSGGGSGGKMRRELHLVAGTDALVDCKAVLLELVKHFAELPKVVVRPPEYRIFMATPPVSAKRAAKKGKATSSKKSRSPVAKSGVVKQTTSGADPESGSSGNSQKAVTKKRPKSNGKAADLSSFETIKESSEIFAEAAAAAAVTSASARSNQQTAFFATELRDKTSSNVVSKSSNTNNRSNQQRPQTAGSSGAVSQEQLTRKSHSNGINSVTNSGMRDDTAIAAAPAVQLKKTHKRSTSSEFLQQTHSRPSTSTGSITKTAHAAKFTEPPSKERARQLTLRSFLVFYRDFVENAIAYNSLFYAKEHMLSSAFASATAVTAAQEQQKKAKRQQNIRIKCDQQFSVDLYSQSSSFNFRPPLPPPPPPRTTAASVLESRRNNKDGDNKSNSSVAMLSNWKEQLPSFFNRLEHLLTTSYRETVHPPLSTKVLNTSKIIAEIKSSRRRAFKLDLLRKCSSATASQTSVASVRANSASNRGSSNSHLTQQQQQQLTPQTPRTPLTNNNNNNNNNLNDDKSSETNLLTDILLHKTKNKFF